MNAPHAAGPCRHADIEHRCPTCRAELVCECWHLDDRGIARPCTAPAVAVWLTPAGTELRVCSTPLPARRTYRSL